MTDAPDSGDLVGDLLAFAFVTAVAVGATLVGMRAAEWLCRDDKRGRGR